MEKYSDKLCYEVEFSVYMPGIGEEYPTLVLTIPQYKILKDNIKDFSVKGYLDEEGNGSPIYAEGVYISEKKLVTKRYYRKRKDRNDEEYAGQIMDEIHSREKGTNQKKKEKDEDGPYHKIICKSDLGSQDITLTIMLTNTEFLTFSKNHDPKEAVFDWNDKPVHISSWKGDKVKKDIYESLKEALHDSKSIVKLLATIEEWICADEKEWLAAFKKANNIEESEVGSDNEEEKTGKDDDGDEDEDKDKEADSEGDNDDDEKEEEEEEEDIKKKGGKKQASTAKRAKGKKGKKDEDEDEDEEEEKMEEEKGTKRVSRNKGVKRANPQPSRSPRKSSSRGKSKEPAKKTKTSGRRR